MPESLKNLIDPDSDVSDRVLKHWLKVNGLPHTADAKSDLLKLLAKLIRTGKLTRERLADAVREIEENGGKRIFLRFLVDKSSIVSQRVFETHLKSINLGLDAAPTITKYKPAEPEINYICWQEKERRIRIKFSETHLKRDVDFEKGTITTEKKTKFVIASVELGTGFASIFFDYPEAVHPHKDSSGKSKSELYEQFYFDWITDIFDSDGLENFDLTKAGKRLVKAVPHIFRIPHETVRTGGNSRQRYVSIKDVRDDPARQGADQADGDNWVYEDLAGYWIPKMSKGKLQRELFMQLYRGSGMIRVLADCLASEVEYVISRLR